MQTADKVIALSRDFRSQRRLAELLGVSPAQVTRWRHGSGIDAANAQRVDLLELAMSSLLRVYSPEAAEDWLLGVNPHLRDRRPVDLMRWRHARSARGDRGRGGRQLRVIVWRVLPVDPAAAEDAAGGPLWFPRERQGAARHDNPTAYGCLYVAETPVSAVAEALAPFRGRGALTPAMLERAGRRLSLAALELREPAGLLDLDEPLTLAAEGLRPSNVATRVRRRTQSDALALFESHRRATGLRWWSTIEASWINVTVFDRARRRLRMRSVELLSADHEAVRAAAGELGLA